MKGKDLAVLGGIGLALYLLVPKAKEVAAAGGVTTVIPMPTATTPGLDVGGLFSGIASIFAAMPQQIIPEINIPEYRFDPRDYIPEVPDWEGMVPDWDKLIAGFAELSPDWDKLFALFGGDGNGDENGDENGNGNGEPSQSLVAKLLRGESLYPTGIVKSLGDTILDLVEAPFKVGQKVFDEGGLFSEEWWTNMMPEWALTEKGKAERAYGGEAEAIFSEAGVTQATPENIQALIEAREKITGQKAEEIPPIGTPAYLPFIVGEPELPHGVRIG